MTGATSEAEVKAAMRRAEAVVGEGQPKTTMSGVETHWDRVWIEPQDAILQKPPEIYR